MGAGTGLQLEFTLQRGNQVRDRPGTLKRELQEERRPPLPPLRSDEGQANEPLDQSDHSDDAHAQRNPLAAGRANEPTP